MDNRHVDPVISLTLHVDWSNPLLYWLIGLFGAIAAAVAIAAL